MMHYVGSFRFFIDVLSLCNAPNYLVSDADPTVLIVLNMLARPSQTVSLFQSAKLDCLISSIEGLKGDFELLLLLLASHNLLAYDGMPILLLLLTNV